MGCTAGRAALIAAALGLPVPEVTQAQATCLDLASTVEQAHELEDAYYFDVANKAVDAHGVHWIGIPDHAIQPRGTFSACWVGGYVEGPYGEESVYECTPIHCPGGICPEPCLAYHTSAGLDVETAAPVTLEAVRVSHYGDGIERSESANREPLLVRDAYLHDLKDDAIENDWGASITVLDSLLERVNTAFASRPRSSDSIDARDRTFEVRDSLVLLHSFSNSYKMEPGHGKVWKWAKDGTGPNFIVTGNTFVVTDFGGGLILPLADQVLECADNVLLWAGTTASLDDWLADPELGSDGLTASGRLAALSGCYTLIVKTDTQAQEDFLAEQFDPLVNAWKQSHAAAGGMAEPPPECADGIDNDGDGFCDGGGPCTDGSTPGDPGCASATDLDERAPELPCDDGQDNDGDGRVDFDPVTLADPGDASTDPAGQGDPVCQSPSYPREHSQCQDGIDNDLDGKIDYDAGRSVNGFADESGPDPQCLGVPEKNREARSRRCGLGFELVWALPLVIWMREYNSRQRFLAAATWRDSA